MYLASNAQSRQSHPTACEKEPLIFLPLKANQNFDKAAAVSCLITAKLKFSNNFVSQMWHIFRAAEVLLFIFHSFGQRPTPR